MPLNLDTPEGDIVLIENALVIPPSAESKGRQQVSGVLTADGTLVENSISWNTSDKAVNAPPAMPHPDTIQELAGTWMFGGIAYGHFGHFLLESLARIWALHELAGKLDGIIFTPKFINPSPQRVFEVYRPLMTGLGADLPARNAVTPLRVERLYVPRQGIGLGDLILGSAKFRSYMGQEAGRNIPAKGAERIYISRSQLPPMRGGLIGEPLLEQLLTDEGYKMYHPQREPADSQIAQYKAANDIIAVDCSPLHLVAYAGHAGQRVAIVTRRSMAIADTMANQISSFSGADAFEVNTLVRDWVPANANRAGRSSFGEIDFPRTYEILKARGMIASDTPWPALTDEQRKADLERIETSHKIQFRALNETTAVQPQPQPSPAPTAPTSS